MEIDEAGRLEAAVAKGYQAQIERAIYQTTQVNGEISGVQASINPLQNVLATDQIKIRLDIRPKGYAKFISVELGFINPAAN